MIRLMAPAPVVWNRSKMRAEAFALWPNLVDINEVNAGQICVAVYFESGAPTQAAVNAFVAAHDPTPPPPTAEQLQVAADRTQVIAFFNAPSGSATPAQRDDTIKAIIRYLRRSGNDA